MAMNKNQNESVQQAADRPKTLRIVLSIVIAFFVWMAAMLAARIAETCFFIGFSPFLPFGLCGASSFCVPRDVSILENFFHFVQR